MQIGCVFCLLISVLVHVCQASSGEGSEIDAKTALVTDGDYFYGAVVEYGGLYNYSAEESVVYNLEQYKSAVQAIAGVSEGNVSIIVFPEGGLQKTRPTGLYGEIVPTAGDGVTPCSLNNTKILKELSCLAIQHKVYLVVNLIELEEGQNDTTLYYNTNVVFDRSGKVVARYRKFNIYGKSGKPLTKPAEPDFTYFDTDFGVRFGTFTCFDITFKTPALDLVREHNVTHFVYPVGWISELPFLTAIQMQAGWAYANKAVLMASGFNDPSQGSTGTGVYAGKRVFRAEQTEVSQNFAIIAAIPKDVTRPAAVETTVRLPLATTAPSGERELKLLEDRLDAYATELVVENATYVEGEDGLVGQAFRESVTTVESRVVCDGSLCCNFTLQFVAGYAVYGFLNASAGDAFGRGRYRLAAFDGVRSYGGGIATGGVQVCAVIACSDGELGSCARPTYGAPPEKRLIAGFPFWKRTTAFNRIRVSARMTVENDTLLMPDVLARSDLADAYGRVADADGGGRRFDFVQRRLDETTVEAEMAGDGDLAYLGSFGFYARVFGRDGSAASPARVATTTTTSTEKPPPPTSGGGAVVRHSLVLLAAITSAFVMLSTLT